VCRPRARAAAPRWSVARSTTCERLHLTADPWRRHVIVNRAGPPYRAGSSYTSPPADLAIAASDRPSPRCGEHRSIHSAAPSPRLKTRSRLPPRPCAVVWRRRTDLSSFAFRLPPPRSMRVPLGLAHHRLQVLYRAGSAATSARPALALIATVPRPGLAASAARCLACRRLASRCRRGGVRVRPAAAISVSIVSCHSALRVE